MFKNLGLHLHEGTVMTILQIRKLRSKDLNRATSPGSARDFHHSYKFGNPKVKIIPDLLLQPNRNNQTRPSPHFSTQFTLQCHQNELTLQIQKEASNKFPTILSGQRNIHKLFLIALTYFIMTLRAGNISMETNSIGIDFKALLLDNITGSV